MQYLRLLRLPIPRWLWIGQSLSATGSRLHSLAILWLAYQLTGSAFAMGATGLLDSIAVTVMGLAGSAIADRNDRLAQAMSVDFVRAVVVLSLPVLVWTGHLHYVELLGASVLMSALDAWFDPAFQGALPQLIGPDRFYAFAGLMDTPHRLARIFGPGLVGLLLKVLPVAGLFVLDAISFLASAVSIVRVRFLQRKQGERPTRAASVSAKAAAWRTWSYGLRIVARQTGLRLIFIIDGIGNVGFPVFSIGGLLLCTRTLHVGLAGYGLLIGAYGIGSLIGNGIAGNLRVGIPRQVQAVFGWSVIGVAFAGLGLVPDFWLALCLSALAGAFGAMAHVSRAVFMASVVPADTLSKVHGVRGMNSTVCAAMGMGLCGGLIDAVGVRSAFLTVGCVLVAVSLPLLALMVRSKHSDKPAIVQTQGL